MYFMESRRTKVHLVYMYLLLLSSSLIPPSLTQQFKKVNQDSFIPNGQFRTFPPHKGYFPPQAGGLDYYYNHAVNTQYWTGSGPNHLQQFNHPLHQQYNGYPPFYQPGLWNDYHMGFSQGTQWNTMSYPGFDPTYWTGAHYNPNYYAPVYPQQYPAYPHPVYPPHPMYHPQAPYHPAYYPNHPAYYHNHPAYYKNAMYPGQYLYHQGPYGADPYSQKGFLGGTGKGLAKGLLGALLVGVVAGAVARGK